ncbi:uncharacterized protein LOC117786924 [Drosophila innubila]|uniref:uncharacterized protein LOC117786924 n=1 Tax=Drosophila innubila TaxID=198719 RepID=UPI00148B7895|nr:uncharacterized protein LOC117786924 [Drosophila innubila]
MLKHLLLWCSVGFLMSMAHVTFTNLKCSYANESFGQYKQCRIKAFNRTHKYIMIHGELKWKPLNNITVNIKLLRHDHGYKPFFVDTTFDACKFLKNQRIVIVNMFYNTVKKYSNMNHTCPYNHDIIIDKLWTGNQDDDFAKYIPFPNGDFAVFLTFYAYNIELSKIELYIRITR